MSRCVHNSQWNATSHYRHVYSWVRYLRHLTASDVIQCDGRTDHGLPCTRMLLQDCQVDACRLYWGCHRLVILRIYSAAFGSQVTILSSTWDIFRILVLSVSCLQHVIYYNDFLNITTRLLIFRYCSARFRGIIRYCMIHMTFICYSFRNGFRRSIL